jgi:TrmH family RNA methyltransferase
LIESNSNSQIKYIAHLKKVCKFRKKEQIFLVEGVKMVNEALTRNLAVKIYIAESFSMDQLEVINCPVETVTDKIFKEVSDTTNPQGVLALVRMPQYNWSDYLEKEDAALLCLEDINDPGNLGTMMRTAEGAGMSAIVISKNTVDPYNPKVVRATMGAMFRMPVLIREDFLESMKELKEKSFHIYAAHLDGKCNYSEESYGGKVAILIGNEANGLTDEATALSDKKVLIPMKGQLESLNAAVSAAILMYEVARNHF